MLRLVKIVLLVLLAPLAALADTGGVGLKPDLRLLIDISGSMKTSDPDNLRAPALDLLVRFLPEGARAGVWSFGEDVEILVPHGIVDSEWRKQARAAMAQIDNSGQRTNIPAAIHAATFDLERMDPGFRTSIVLLTDGKVDVAESPMVNAGAARSLLASEARTLGATGIPVHTIALSDEADWVFLRSLARASGGIAEQAQSAENLSAVFFRALEIAAPTERVPFGGSRFAIDDSVDEFTALVFYDGNNRRLELIGPSGEKYRSSVGSSGVDWFQNQQFALVTVSQPEAGEWRLIVPEDATVRISVLSDIGLEIDPPPASIPVGRHVELGLWISNRSVPIVDVDVLKAFTLEIDIKRPDGKSDYIDVSTTYPAPADGEYRVLIPGFDLPGRYEILVSLDGQTLRRELSLQVEVAPQANQATLVTRGQEPPEDDFKSPLAILLAAIAVALAVTGLILRRRKQRKLEIWQRRSRQFETGAFAREPLKGVSATDNDGPGAA